MTEKTKRLNVVLDLAEQEVDKAADALSSAQHELTKERQKLDEMARRLYRARSSENQSSLEC